MKLKEAENTVPNDKGDLYIDYRSGQRVALKGVRVKNARRVMGKRPARYIKKARLLLRNRMEVIFLVSDGEKQYEMLSPTGSSTPKTRPVKWMSPMRLR